MKTPREILLERHREAEGKLDAIRQAVVAEKTPRSAWLMRELLLPLRWHLAGLSGVWLMVALLNADYSTPIVAAEASSSPRQLIVVLAENRRQLVEMIEPTAAELTPAAPPPFVPRRRSGAQPISAVV